jgi:hypothetical protein
LKQINDYYNFFKKCYNGWEKLLEKYNYHYIEYEDLILCLDYHINMISEFLEIKKSNSNSKIKKPLKNNHPQYNEFIFKLKNSMNFNLKMNEKFKKL